MVRLAHHPELGRRTMTQTKNIPMKKTVNFQWLRFNHFVIRYSNLFRISDLDIRILPEHDFSFRHYLGFALKILLPERIRNMTVFFCILLDLIRQILVDYLCTLMGKIGTMFSNSVSANLRFVN
jgi:hypothetical protein